MPKIRPNPDGPDALTLTWDDAERLRDALANAMEDAKLDNNSQWPPESGVSMMWCDWPFSININC